MKRLSSILAILSLSFSLCNAQTIIERLKLDKENLRFNHLDLSLTAGSTGIGFDLAMPVNEMIDVRAGATFMPTFQKKMTFPIEVGETDPSLSQSQVDAINEERFSKLSDLLYNFMGMRVNNSVDMIGEPTFNNVKFLVDVKPFKNKRQWHFTAGFYYGGKRFAKAFNTSEDMTSLVGVASYNSMYNKVLAQEPLISYGNISLYNPQLYEKIAEYGRMTMHVGDFSHDIYATEDVYYDYTELDPIFLEPKEDANGRPIKKGELRFKKGEKMYSKGEAYRMVPDADCMVKADAYINKFRPYLGFGYGDFIGKDNRTAISFDCGLMFWGGVPKVVTHDGIDLRNDLTNVRHSVQRYLDTMSHFPVFPVLNIRLTQRLF